jgi:hypothetical protein
VTVSIEPSIDENLEKQGRSSCRAIERLPLGGRIASIEVDNRREVFRSLGGAAIDRLRDERVHGVGLIGSMQLISVPPGELNARY